MLRLHIRAEGRPVVRGAVYSNLSFPTIYWEGSVRYYLTKVDDGGHTKEEIGRVSGILFIFKKSCASISLKFIL